MGQAEDQELQDRQGAFGSSWLYTAAVAGLALSSGPEEFAGDMATSQTMTQLVWLHILLFWEQVRKEWVVHPSSPSFMSC